VTWLGSNGASDRCPECFTRVTTDTRTSTTISTPKNRPASLVETDTPRSIMTTAPAVSSTVKMPQGTSTCT